MNRVQAERFADEIFDAAKGRIMQCGWADTEQQLKDQQPIIYQFITRAAFDAIVNRFAGLGPESSAAVYDAIWDAAMLAVEACRIAASRETFEKNFRLWMQQLDFASPAVAVFRPVGGAAGQTGSKVRIES